MSKKVFGFFRRYLPIAVLTLGMLGFLSRPAASQSMDESSGQLESLRSDVGIHGLTANFHWLSDFSYLKDGNLQKDGSSELEIVYRDVRMMTQRLGVGFQVLTSFFVDSPNAGFGVGSWGAGPVFRAYPLKTDRVQPYVQANALFGNNLAVSKLANSANRGNGFRMRLGLRAGTAVRLGNSWGLFAEIGYDWESGTFFQADSRALQANIGFDYYLFN